MIRLDRHKSNEELRKELEELSKENAKLWETTSPADRWKVLRDLAARDIQMGVKRD